MIDKFKQLWVRALRGGKFEQTTGLLRAQDNKCCCLGVLCDLVEPSGWQASVGSRYTYNGNAKRLTSDFLNKVGLTEDEQGRLIELNDSGHSFKAIANYIDQKL